MWSNLPRILGLILIACLFFIRLAPLLGQNIYTQDTWEARDDWQDVPRIMRAMGIRPGMVVADIGCHQGYMTMKFVDEVGPNGRVYAVDVNSSRLAALQNLLEAGKIDNVTTVLGGRTDPKLPPHVLDYAFIMDTYHEIDNGIDMLKHIKTSLKPDGKLVILEPISKDRRGWERRRQEDRHEIDIKYVIQDVEKAGFKVLTRHDPFIDRRREKKDELWFLMATPASAAVN